MRVASYSIFAGAIVVAILENVGVIEPPAWLIWPVCAALLAWVLYLDRRIRRDSKRRQRDLDRRRAFRREHGYGKDGYPL